MRRRALRGAAIAIGVIAAVLGAWALWLEPASLTTDEVALNLPWRSRAVVDHSNAASPDVVCILGDLVIQGVVGGSFVPPETIATELSRLRAPGGILAVLGNHDGWFDHDRVRRAIEGRGIRVIEDTAVELDSQAGPFWVAFFPMVPSRVTLTLAGHTHGGQVRVPFFGPSIVPSNFGQRFAAGHVAEGGRHLFVATGVGTSILPIRFLVPPAVTILTLGGDVHQAR